MSCRLDHLLFALAVVACTSCVSTTDSRPRTRMPFHVALAPVQVQAISNTSNDAAEEQYEVHLDADLASKLLLDELNLDLFVLVSPLAEVDGTETLSVAQKQQRQTEAWLSAARALDADLLFVPELRYETKIRPSRDLIATMLNIPVFLFLGPCSYWIADNRYSVEATLNGRLVDLHRVGAVSSSIDWATVATVRTKFDGATFDFNERADGATEYIWTMICPPTFLKSKSKSVASSLERRILADLARSAAHQLASDEQRVLRPDVERSFYVPSGQLTARLHSDSTLAIEAPVFLPTHRSDDFLKSFSLYVGEFAYDGFFQDPVPSDAAIEGRFEQLSMYRLAARIDGPAIARDTFSLEVTGGDGAVRTFTGRIQRVSTPYIGDARPVEASAVRRSATAIEAIQGK